MLSFEGTARFRVVRQLGAGGMGVVFEAHDVERDERVALKTLQELDAEGLVRFKREFRALHGFEHPNLVRLGELFENDGIWFFTMELVPGVDFLSHVWKSDWHAIQERAASAPTVPEREEGVSAAAAISMFPGVEGVYVEDRLRAALRQLATGLAAIHAAGKVHRDVKPNNVSITPEGRLVILDFGLITGVTHSDRSTVAGFAGTPAYMAPEQVAGEHVGPGADWFAVGVMLFQALTGRLPIDGKPLHILKEKGRFRAPSPRALNPQIPEDLDALCVRLLELDPIARLDGPAILEQLGAGAASGRSSLPPSRPSETTFIGRSKQLGDLRDAWADRAGGRASVVLVDGASGMGKSALLGAFIREVLGDDGSAVVLRGRAFEHENIPYNLFDRVVDSLSRLLRSLPVERAAELLPLNAFLLPRVFPVLGRVEAVLRLSRRINMQLDAHELRTRIFAALRELLARVAERRPLLVILDDVQWAGRDSLMLLGELLRPPKPPAMMLVLSSREGRIPDPYAGVSVRAGQWWVLPDDLRRVSLGPLAGDDAIALATALIEQSGLQGLDPAAVAEEAEGHPLFIQELVRHAVASSGPDSERPRLDDTILKRVNALDEPLRDLLALTAMAGGPLGLDVLARAMQTSQASLGRDVSALEKDHLLRADLVGEAPIVEPYHDRVRVAVAGDLPEGQRKDLHRRLAAAHEASANPDAVQLTRHLAGAGDLPRAGLAAYRAAEAAEQGLAFDRAADLFRLCIDLAGESTAVRERLAAALVRAGRCCEAADAYLEASSGREGPAALELRGVAAQHAVRGGQLDRGLDLARDVLRRMGVRPPKSTVGVVVGVLWLRLRLALRGMTPEKAGAKPASPAELARVDLLHDIAAVLLGADPFLGRWMSTRALLMALDCGEPVRLARSLALDAAGLSGVEGGWSPAVKKRIDIVRDLELALDRPSAWTLAMMGAIDFMAARYATSVNRIEEAVTIFADQPGAHFEVFAPQIVAAGSLFGLGRLASLRELSGRMLRAAAESGDAYHSSFYRVGAPNLATWLAADQPDRALEEAAEAASLWTRERFDVLAFLGLQARVDNALYRGDGRLAWAELSRVWRRVGRSGLTISGVIRVVADDLYGRSAISAAAAERGDQRRALVDEAVTAARRLEAKRNPGGRPRAAILRAAVARLAGDDAEAMVQLRRAAAEFDALEMAGHATAVRYQLGVLEGGDDGRRAIATAEAWFHEQGVRRPERWVAMLVPAAPGREPVAVLGVAMSR